MIRAMDSGVVIEDVDVGCVAVSSAKLSFRQLRMLDHVFPFIPPLNRVLYSSISEP